MAVIANHGPGHDQGRTDRSAPARRGQSRADVRISPRHLRPEPQPRAVGSALGARRDRCRLDSGGNYHGYIGDLARMAILGEPDAELEDMLGEIEEIQRIAMKPIRPGVLGGEIYAVAEERMKKSKHHNHMHFLGAWHGPGQP